MRRLTALAVAAVCLAGCHKKSTNTTPNPDAGSGAPGRCEIDLSAWTQATGSGASAVPITDASQLIGGEAANGRLGDTLLANDKARFIIQQPGRVIGPDPFGGALIDADTVHSGPGNDKFGKLAPFFNFGRTVDVKTVEVLAKGDQGGAAIVAATGTDTINDYINIKSQIASILPGQSLALDPDKDVNLRVTTYYALLPGQQHLSIVTAFCNDAATTLVLTAGDLIDSGGDVALLDPQSGTHGLGYRSNPDPMTWLAWLATDNSIAYGVAPWKLNDLSTPETHSNSLTVAGVTGYIIGNAAGLSGLTEWLDPNKRGRSGTLIVPAAANGKPGSVVIGREFAVGKDAAEVASILETVRAAKVPTTVMATYSGTVTDPQGPVPGARVVAERPDPDGFNATEQEAVFVTDASGHFSASLPQDAYTFTAYKPGHAISAAVQVANEPNAGSNIALTIGQGRTLTVNVHDATGAPIPAKVTVLCSGTCATTPANLVRFEDFPGDSRPDDVQLVGYVTPSGTEQFALPAGQYQLLVTYGPEYSIWPATGPSQGAAVDLSGGDQTVNAVLAKVVDTSGWLSADFHVHCVNSPDSPVAVVDRAKTFLAEDLNVLLSTDHDFITDYAPTNHDLGGDGRMATMVGIEVTTFDYGHFNPWPVRLDASNPVNHGALDWGNGTGPSLLIDDLFAKMRSDLQATTVQINHPNGGMSTFGGLKLDAATLKTHATPDTFRLPPSPYATADDTGLFPRSKWDAMEVMNGFTRSSFNGLINNWATFNANGLTVTGTAVSDTHKRWSSAAGYPRSYVLMGAGHDSIATFDKGVMSQAVNAHHVTGSLGLFVKVYAFKAGTTYSLSSLEADCSAAGASCARIGDTVPFDATGGDVVVDVQSPEWIDFNEIDLFDHRAARPMTDGQPDTDFAPEQPPAAGYWTQSASPTLETVYSDATGALGCGSATCTARRRHAQAVFHVDGQSGHPDVPAGDDFYFVVVRDSNSSHDLMPLVYDGVMDSNGKLVETPAHAFAFTNALYIDRDGNGYDHPPHVSQPASPKHPRAKFVTGSLAWRLHELLHEIDAEP